jgi:DNA-binding response OmpR family regulator
MPKILIIEDDEPFLKMLRLTLERMGHTVLEAHNGKIALGIYQSESPDLVITDLIMPEQEGLETIRRLKKTDPTVKIIAMSGGGRITPGGFLKMARQMGAAYTLTKPFSNDELHTTITTLLNKTP